MQKYFIILLLIILGCANQSNQIDDKMLIIKGKSDFEISASKAKEKALDNAEYNLLKQIGINAEVTAKQEVIDKISEGSFTFEYLFEYENKLDFQGYLKYKIESIESEKKKDRFVGTATIRFSEREYQSFKNDIIADILSFDINDINDAIYFLAKSDEIEKFIKLTPGIKPKANLMQSLTDRRNKITEYYSKKLSEIKVIYHPYTIFDDTIYFTIEGADEALQKIYVNGKEATGKHPQYSFSPKFADNENLKMNVMCGYKTVSELQNLQIISNKLLLSPYFSNNIRFKIESDPKLDPLAKDFEEILTRFGYSKSDDFDIKIKLSGEVKSCEKYLQEQYIAMSKIDFDITTKKKRILKFTIPNNLFKNTKATAATAEIAKHRSLNLIGHPGKSLLFIRFMDIIDRFRLKK